MKRLPWVLCLMLLGCFDYGGGGGGGGGGGAGGGGAASFDAGSAGGGGADAGPDIAGAFASAVSVQGATVTVGPLPPAGMTNVVVLPAAPTAPPVEVRVTPADAGGGSSSLTINVPYQGGGVSAVNIGFGTSTSPPTSFITVATPAAMSVTGGVLQVPAQVMAGFCAGLSAPDVCHQIACYEQVVTSQGTFSKTTALQMLINCTGKDCNGNSVDAGTVTDGGACNSAQTSGSDTPDSRSIALGRSSGSFLFSYDTYTQADQMRITYQGSTLFDTGCVGEARSVMVSYSGTSSNIVVSVFPNCAGGTGTSWNYTVGCP